MKILVHGRFFPNVGGIETVVNVLVREWVRTGNEVIIVSNLPGTSSQVAGLPFRVVYQPSLLKWLRLVKWSEVVLHMNLSLKAFWPHLLIKRPLVVSHQSFYRSNRSYTTYTWREWLKLMVMRWASANIATSAAIAGALPVRCRVIPNPYDNRLFNSVRPVLKDRDLMFVGRLVAEKGADLLLAAMASLPDRWSRIRLTMVGDGPERDVLEKEAKKLAGAVDFAGALDQAHVASELRRHKVLVVPSVYEEPFGVVALEGAGCGCVVVGSDGGGLPEAIGPAGLTFRRGSSQDLGSKIENVLRSPPEKASGAIAAHLERHQPARIAAEYRQVLERVLQRAAVKV